VPELRQQPVPPVDPAGNDLAAWLDRLTFADRTADEVTALLVDAAEAWALAQGWRVYRRAASVLPLPPPYQMRHSVLDLACARPAGPPVVIEVDHTDRRRTVEKLLAEVAAGREALWIRWGTGRFEPPPADITLVPCVVTHRRGPKGGGMLHSHFPTRDRPPPAHTTVTDEPAAAPIEGL
jgi:hypothetical protein